MNRLIPLLALVSLTACNGGAVDRVFDTMKSEDRHDAKSYSYACLDSTVAGEKTTQRIEKATDFLRNLAVKKSSITDSLQSDYGAAFHQDAVESGGAVLVKDAALQQKLDGMLQRLLAQRTKPSSIRYYVYATEDKEINAFTFGGRIYITRPMLAQCEGNDALLYAIIGHEIGHNESGHIRATIQEMKLSDDVFGENGITFFQLKQMLSASFNQRNELEADYYGVNLTHKMGLDLCTVVDFWRRMGSKENEYSRVEDFLRTHPFSAARAQCLTDHLKTNFNISCAVPKQAEMHPAGR